MIIDGTEDDPVDDETVVSVSSKALEVDNVSIPPPLENETTREDIARQQLEEWEEREKNERADNDQEVISHLPDWLQEKFKEVTADADKERSALSEQEKEKRQFSSVEEAKEEFRGLTSLF